MSELPSTLNERGKAFTKIPKRFFRKPISKQRLRTVSEKTIAVRKCSKCYFCCTFIYLQRVRKFRSEIHVPFYITNFKRSVLKIYCMEYNILRVYRLVQKNVRIENEIKSFHKWKKFLGTYCVLQKWKLKNQLFFSIITPVKYCFFKYSLYLQGKVQVMNILSILLSD